MSLVCPFCHYPMRGLAIHGPHKAIACPECGFAGTPAVWWKARMRRRGFWSKVGEHILGWEWLVGGRLWRRALLFVPALLLAGFTLGAMLLQFEAVEDIWEDVLGLRYYQSLAMRHRLLFMGSGALGFAVVGGGIWLLLRWVIRRLRAAHTP